MLGVHEVPGTIRVVLCMLTHLITIPSNEIGTFICPILQMAELRHRGLRYFLNSYRTLKLGNVDYYAILPLLHRIYQGWSTNSQRF